MVELEIIDKEDGLDLAIGMTRGWKNKAPI